MNDLVDRDRKLPANKAKLNKAKLHMDTHMHRYIDADSTLITSEETTSGYGYNTWTHVPDSGELLIHHHHIFRETGTACTHSKSGMVAYQGGVLTVCAGIVIILLCVTNITASMHLKSTR